MLDGNETIDTHKTMDCLRVWISFPSQSAREFIANPRKLNRNPGINLLSLTSSNTAWHCNLNTFSDSICSLTPSILSMLTMLTLPFQTSRHDLEKQNSSYTGFITKSKCLCLHSLSSGLWALKPVQSRKSCSFGVSVLLLLSRWHEKNAETAGLPVRRSCHCHSESVVVSFCHGQVVILLALLLMFAGVIVSPFNSSRWLTFDFFVMFQCLDSTKWILVYEPIHAIQHGKSERQTNLLFWTTGREALILLIPRVCFSNFDSTKIRGILFLPLNLYSQ